MFDFEYSVGDLFGLGLNISPEQIALLEQPEGKALFPMALTDPFEEEMPAYDRNPDTGNYELIMLPAILTFGGDVEYSGRPLSEQLDQWIGPIWRRWPSLVGDGVGPADNIFESGVVRIWDCQPVTDAQASALIDEADRAMNQTDWELQRVWSKHVAEEIQLSEEELERVKKDLSVLTTIDEDGREGYLAGIGTGRLVPQFTWDLDCERLWRRCLRSSKRGWDALERSFADKARPYIFEHEESLFCPWYPMQ